MRKIFLMSILFMFLLSAYLVFASYDSSTGKATYRFTKGWNLYPILGGDDVGNNCELEGKGGPPETLAYLYSPLSKKYIMVGDVNKQIEEEQKIYGIQGKNYLYPYGAWFYYTKKDCDAWIIYKSGGINPFLDIVKGWQFVAKLPFMKQYAVTFGNCTIEKFNQWDNSVKDWKFKPSETSITKLESVWNSAEVGEAFVMRFANDCTLGYRMEDIYEVPAPPALE